MPRRGQQSPAASAARCEPIKNCRRENISFSVSSVAGGSRIEAAAALRRSKYDLNSNKFSFDGYARPVAGR